MRERKYSYAPKNTITYMRSDKRDTLKNGMAYVKHLARPSRVRGYQPINQTPKFVTIKKKTEENNAYENVEITVLLARSFVPKK
jgi:hypothetical protein